jgi:hypothetical protein
MSRFTLHEISRAGSTSNNRERWINANKEKTYFEFLSGDKNSKEFTRFSAGKKWQFNKWQWFDIEIEEVKELNTGVLRRTARGFELTRDEAEHLRNLLNKFLEVNGK